MRRAGMPRMTTVVTRKIGPAQRAALVDQILRRTIPESRAVSNLRTVARAVRGDDEDRSAPTGRAPNTGSGPDG